MFGRIYGRFSSKPQERGDSYRRQTEGATEYAKTHNPPIEIIETYFDEAVSGKAGANLEKEFGRLLKEAKSGETILVEQVDRIGRQHPVDVLNILKSQMVDRGLTVTFWQKHLTIDATNIGNPNVLFSLFGETTVGYSDNQRKMERLIMTTREAFKQGVKGVQSGTLVKYLPQCYEWNESQQKIEIDEVKADVIKKIFNWYCEGIGVTTIAQLLNKSQTPTLYKNGTQTIGKRLWQESSIKKVLKNESFSGVLYVKGHKITCIPSVISPDTFNKAQLLIKRNSNRHGKLSGRINNIFANIAVCKHCGSTVNVSVSPPKKKGGKTCFLYRCKGAKLHNCEHRRMLNARNVEISFMTEYFGGSPETTFHSKNKDLQTKALSLEAKIERLNTSIENLFDMVETGDKTAKDRIQQRRIEKSETERELVIVKGSIFEHTNVPSMMDEIAEVMDFTADSETASKLLKEFIPKLEAKLNNNEVRRKLVNTFPSIFSKVVIDTTERSIQATTKQGVKMKKVFIDQYNESTLEFIKSE